MELPTPQNRAEELLIESGLFHARQAEAKYAWELAQRAWSDWQDRKPDLDRSSQKPWDAWSRRARFYYQLWTNAGQRYSALMREPDPFPFR
jgi:hypothetical protein